MRRWYTPEDDATITAMWNAHAKRGEIAETLGRTECSIRDRAHRLGLTFGPPRPSSWAPFDDQLRELWADRSLNASQIAVKLGVASRSMVLGRIYRLGLSGPRSQERRERAMERAKQPKRTNPFRPPSRKAPKRLPAELQCTDPDEMLPFVAPTNGECWWHADEGCAYIIGDPRGEVWHWCNTRAMMGKSYCPFHVEICEKTPV
jgi:hypothetical protein